MKKKLTRNFKTNKEFRDWYDRTERKVLFDIILNPLWGGKKMKFPIKFNIKSNPNAFKPSINT